MQNWINCEHHLGVRDAQFVVGQGLDQWWWWHLPPGVTSWPQQRSVSIRHPERNHWSLISKCLLGSDSLMTRFMISASKWWMLKRKGRQWYMFVKKDLKLALTWIWTKSYFHEVGGQNQNSWSADSLSFSLMGQVLSILNPPKLLATCKSFY